METRNGSRGVGESQCRSVGLLVVDAGLVLSLDKYENYFIIVPLDNADHRAK